MSEERAAYHRAAEQLRATFGAPPTGALVLGSGGGSMISRWPTVQGPVPVGELGLPMPTVAGHAGAASVVECAGQRLLVLSGRPHRYEGHGNEALLRPVRALRAWGVERLVLMSAVGSLRPEVGPGALVRITDHISFAENPLLGNPCALGPRFPDLTGAYSARLGALLVGAAATRQRTLHAGVYAMMSGPSYETPAEVRALRGMGGDVVGMSMPMEVIGAAHVGLEVLGVAVVSNFAAGLAGASLDHDEVLEIVSAAISRLGVLLEDVIARW